MHHKEEILTRLVTHTSMAFQAISTAVTLIHSASIGTLHLVRIFSGRVGETARRTVKAFLPGGDCAWVWRFRVLSAEQRQVWVSASVHTLR